MSKSDLDIFDRWFDEDSLTEKSIDELLAELRANTNREGAALVCAAMQEVALRRATRLVGIVEEKNQRPIYRRAKIALAASIIVITAGAIVWAVVLARDNGRSVVKSGRVLVDGMASKQVSDGKTIDIPPGAPCRLKLSDGSTLTLDAGSKASLQLASGKDRIVQLLTGAADLDVVRQDRAFVVQTSIAKVRVRGTRFRVDLVSQGLVKVTVRQGAVAVACGRSETSMNAGDQRDFVLLADGRGGPLVYGAIPSLNQWSGEIAVAGAAKSTYSLRNVSVTIDGKKADIEQLKAGMSAAFVLSPNERELLEIRAARSP